MWQGVVLCEPSSSGRAEDHLVQLYVIDTSNQSYQLLLINPDRLKGSYCHITAGLYAYSLGSDVTFHGGAQYMTVSFSPVISSTDHLLNFVS